MNPEIARELAAQHGREMRDRAHQATLARAASKSRRASRRGLSGLEDGHEIVLPAIPDYIDGSFREASVHDQVAGQPGPVPSTGRVAERGRLQLGATSRGEAGLAPTGREAGRP